MLYQSLNIFVTVCQDRPVLTQYWDHLMDQILPELGHEWPNIGLGLWYISCPMISLNDTQYTDSKTEFHFATGVFFTVMIYTLYVFSIAMTFNLQQCWSSCWFKNQFIIHRKMWLNKMKWVLIWWGFIKSPPINWWCAERKYKRTTFHKVCSYVTTCTIEV